MVIHNDSIDNLYIAKSKRDSLCPMLKTRINGASMNFVPVSQLVYTHQQKTFPSGRNGSVRVDALRHSRQRHHGGGLLHARGQYHASHCISPSDGRFAVSSRSVGHLFQTNSLAGWPTVTICQNGFIGYTLASGLQYNG